MRELGRPLPVILLLECGDPIALSRYDRVGNRCANLAFHTDGKAIGVQEAASINLRLLTCAVQHPAAPGSKLAA